MASLLAGVSPVEAATSKRAVANRQAAPDCDWSRPGHMPFMGDVVGAVDHYQDIPAPVRARLKQRMAERRYDEIVTIKRDSISGTGQYDGAIRQMHFGDSGMCATVTRKAWTPDMQERGLVYCESGECILVPTVCRNVSRISRLAPGGPVAGGAAAQAPGGEVVYDPTSAGPLAAPPGGLDPGVVPGAAPPFSEEALPPTGAGPIAGVPIFPAYYPTPGNPIAVPVLVPGVPEPHSLLMMLAGLAALALVVRRRRFRG